MLREISKKVDPIRKELYSVNKGLKKVNIRLLNRAYKTISRFPKKEDYDIFDKGPVIRAQ